MGSRTARERRRHHRVPSGRRVVCLASQIPSITKPIGISIAVAAQSQASTPLDQERTRRGTSFVAGPSSVHHPTQFLQMFDCTGTQFLFHKISEARIARL
jgi:hypothetical protein